MTLYTLQVSDHPEAHYRIPTEAAAQSWRTVYDGPMASDRNARMLVDLHAKKHLCVRVFKGGNTLGKFHYGVFRPAPEPEPEPWRSYGAEPARLLREKNS